MRSVFVQRKVLELYQNMDSVSYPIQPELLLQCIPKSCRILSYQEMAEVTGCTVQDVAVLCKSNSGATHYDPDTNRYLILYNAEMNAGRIRWTLAHEIGHIYIGHLEVIEGAEIAYNEQRGFYDQFESEADYFAWNLLLRFLSCAKWVSVLLLRSRQHTGCLIKRQHFNSTDTQNGAEAMSKRHGKTECFVYSAVSTWPK